MFLFGGKKDQVAVELVDEFGVDSLDFNQAPVKPKERHSFTEMLLAKGLISKNEAEAALLEQRITKERVGAILVRNGFLRQDKLIPEILSFKADRIATEQVNSSRIPVDLLEKMSVIISAETDEKVYVGTAWEELEVTDLIRQFYPEKEIEFVAFLSENMPDFLDRMRRTDSGDNNLEDTRPEDMLDRLLFAAMSKGASDIHIEPRGVCYVVFFRLLGERHLHYIGTVEEYTTITAQIKDRSRMDLAERRTPQDGGFQIEMSGKFVDLRVATAPIADGEQVVVRILDPDGVNPDLEKIGISGIDEWRKGINRQNGICLVCGPTGSGKTTTLNSSVRDLDRFGKAIYTIEDPVEYRIPFVKQVSANFQVGLDFPRGVRAFMRGDPDIIVIGEVRDEETARNAIKAADTGHLVIATLHTSTIQSSISRLRDLGIRPHELTYILRSVLVQTLVKTICETCSGSGVLEEHRCPTCAGTGYGGRRPVSECVYFSDNKEVQVVLDMVSADSKSSGVMPWKEMIEDAVDVMVAGDTTIDELRRVFGPLADERALRRGLNPEDYSLVAVRQRPLFLTAE